MRSLAIAILTVALASCSATLTAQQRAAIEAGNITTNICEIFPTISYDGNRDTQLTKDQIKRFNRARKALCEGDTK